MVLFHLFFVFKKGQKTRNKEDEMATVFQPERLNVFEVQPEKGDVFVRLDNGRTIRFLIRKDRISIPQSPTLEMSVAAENAVTCVTFLPKQ